MTLPTPNLDDRRFQDLVDEAKRLIPQYCPDWTNHNVSDPGVALIELFAHMTEQTLYRLNRVPDRLYTVFLNMVGIEPYPARAAVCDLLFRVSAQADAVVIPIETEVATRSDAAGAVIFVTQEELVLHTPELTACFVTTPDDTPTDRWDDLRFGQVPVACFEPLEPGASIMFGFATSMARHVLQLDVHAIASGLGIAPEDPPLRWEASTDEGWAETMLLGDGTGGLNKNGVIELGIPARHDPLTVGDIEAYWIRVQLLRPRRNQRPYETSPEIRSLAVATVGGVSKATHGEHMEAEGVAISDGTPGQRYPVDRAPILPRRSDETVRIVTAAGSEEWTEVEHFGDSGPDDPHFRWHSATGEIEFGPETRTAPGATQQWGAIPTLGSQIVATGYRVGGGARGNVGAGTLRVLRTTIPFVDSVTNLSSARGGAEAESVEEAKRRAPLTLRTGRRAVTSEDFMRLAREATGAVARAHSVDDRGGTASVKLLIVPDVTGPAAGHAIDDFELEDDLFMTLVDYFEPRRIVGTTVEIGTPFYEGVSIAVLVRAVDDVDPGPLEQRVLEALYRYTHPLYGGPDGTGVPFGWTLTTDDIRQVAAVQDGVDSVEDVALFATDLRRDRRLGGSLETLTLPPGSLFLGYRHQVAIR